MGLIRTDEIWNASFEFRNGIRTHLVEEWWDKNREKARAKYRFNIFRGLW